MVFLEIPKLKFLHLKEEKNQFNKRQEERRKNKKQRTKTNHYKNKTQEKIVEISLNTPMAIVTENINRVNAMTK